MPVNIHRSNVLWYNPSTLLGDVLLGGRRTTLDGARGTGADSNSAIAGAEQSSMWLSDSLALPGESAPQPPRGDRVTQSIGVPLVIGGNAVPKRARELGVGALPLAMWNDFLFAGADGGALKG